MLKSYHYIALEFTLLCLALPTFIWMTGSGHMMFAFLWGAAIYTGVVWWLLKTDASSFGLTKGSQKNQTDPLVEPKGDGLWMVFKTEWNWGAVNWPNLKPVLFRWVIATISICAFTWLYEPDRLFHIPREMPQIIPFLVLAYPILSALPQEFIFCSFFMKRYGHWFKADWMKILISAIVFGYAHMLFLNWVAPVFSFFGGLIFAYTYIKTRSLALVTFEHALYGNSIFLAGIGYYFYSGGIGQ
jgi:uncharacterized protein